MTHVENLAAFVSRGSFDQLSPKARDQLKICVLDALGCALGALAAQPIRLIREQVDEFGGASPCTVMRGILKTTVSEVNLFVGLSQIVQLECLPFGSVRN